MIRKRTAILAETITKYGQSVGILSSAALQYLIVIITLDRSNIEMVGSYSLSQAIAMPIFAFFAFSLRPLWVAGLFGERSFVTMLCLRGVMTLLAITAMAFVVHIWQIAIPTWLFAFVVFSKALDNLSDIAYAAMDRGGQSANAGVCLFTKSAFLAVLLGISWLLGVSLYKTYLSFALVQAVVFLGEFWLAKRAARDLRFTIASSPPFRLILFSALNSLVASVIGYVPRYGLEAFVGREAVGYFSLVFIPVSMIGMISTGIAQSNLRGLSEVLRVGTLGQLWSKSFPILSRILILNALMVLCFGILSFLPGDKLFSEPHLMKHMMWVTVLTVPAALLQFSSYIAMASGSSGKIFALSCGILMLQAALTPFVASSWGLWGSVLLYGFSGALQTLGFLKIIRGSYARA